MAVFVDGQNLYKSCREIFGHPLCHPHLLAELLTGPRSLHPIACRFYTGRPNSNIHGEDRRQRNLDRRLDLMRRAGVTVVTRPLRYHWKWSHEEKLPVPMRGLPGRTVTLYPRQRAQEKGIDLALALDVVELALTDQLDVAIVVSLDRDLHEIPGALRRLRGLLQHQVRLEAAVPVPDGRRQPKILPGFSFTHQITRAMFERVRDVTDYTVPDELWVPPRPPLPTGVGR